ncbi:DUF427 domain-containing protein [uncultured Rubinisphaera sp.]|uniref:DUF427 domain-containing protein n=1 Tax=uncultured Rubinisphaera sp. TaxID=1678686 RepID=UPI0030D7EAC4|tara:strand:- start:476 stop:970 length:495 start_codon:yes stop_codon:yes gene_type:complete
MTIERITPDPGQESVWDYPRPPKSEACSHLIKIILDGEVIAESEQTKRVLETSHPPVYYIPTEDICMDFLEPTQGQSWCEWKGKARYFDVVLRERRIEKAAWSYPTPTPIFETIRDHLAFYPHLMDACFVGDEQVQSQAGGFYGGWITSKIVGPFKGEPGTQGW